MSQHNIYIIQYTFKKYSRNVEKCKRYWRKYLHKKKISLITHSISIETYGLFMIKKMRNDNF